MSQERIDIVITENGMRRVKSNLEDIGRTATSVEGALSLLKRTLGGLGLAAFARGLINTADAYTNLQNQVRLVTSSVAELNVVTKELLSISNRTRSDFENTASTYTKVARQASALGLTQNQVLQFTESLNQAIILSGSSSQEASAGIRQLGQAIGSGVLRGDELNSVLENTSEVAMIIAKGMGVTIGSLRALGAQGKISAQDIIQAFQKAREELDLRFAKTVPTVAQAIQVLSNTWTAYIGELNNGTGVTAKLARGIIFLAENLETLGRILAGIAIVVGVALARQAIGYLLVQLQALAAWSAANPFTALLQLIIATTAALVVFSDKITVSSDGFITLADVGVAAFRMLKKGAEFIANQFSLAWEYILQTGHALFGDLVDISLSFPRAIAKSLDWILTRFLSFSAGIVAMWRQMMYNLENPFGGARMDFDQAFKEAFGRSMDKLTEGGKGPVERGLDSLMLEAARVSQERREKEFFAEQDRLKAMKSLDAKPTGDSGKTVAAKHKLNFADLIHRLREEGQQLRLTGVMREAYNNKVAMETKLKRQLTLSERQLVLEVTQNNYALQQRAQILEGLEANSTQFIEKQKYINALMQEAPQLTEALNQELAELEINMLQAQRGGSFVDGYVRQMRIMQLETRNAAADMGASFAAIFGPGGSLSQGIGDAVAQSIVMGERFDQAMKKVAQSVLTNVISSLVQLGINMALNAALGNSLAGAATAASVAEGAAVAAAWAPAAALVNAATFGAGAAAGTTATATSMATIKGLSVVSGFASGGYTGDISRGAVAGVVHGQEYVLNSAATRQIGRANLDRMNSGMSWNQPTMNVTAINKNVPGMQFKTRQLSNTDVEIIAEQVLMKKGPSVIAQDIGNPSGKTRRALGVHTTAKGQRL